MSLPIRNPLVCRTFVCTWYFKDCESWILTIIYSQTSIFQVLFSNKILVTGGIGMNKLCFWPLMLGSSIVANIVCQRSQVIEIWIVTHFPRSISSCLSCSLNESIDHEYVSMCPISCPIYSALIFAAMDHSFYTAASIKQAWIKDDWPHRVESKWIYWSMIYWITSSRSTIHQTSTFPQHPP